MAVLAHETDDTSALVDDIAQIAAEDPIALPDLPGEVTFWTNQAHAPAPSFDGSPATSYPEQTNDVTNLAFDDDWFDFDAFGEPKFTFDDPDAEHSAHCPLDIGAVSRPSTLGPSAGPLSQADGPAQCQSVPEARRAKKEIRFECMPGSHSHQSASDSIAGNGQRNCTRFPRHAVKVLRDWLETHASNPYPTEQERSELEIKTQLRPSQVSNWLANARRRIKAAETRRPNLPTVPSQTGSTAPIAIPGASDKPWDELNPFERWKHSPPENEPASITDIAHAVANSHLRKQSGSPSTGRPKRSSNGSGLSKSRPASTASLDTGRTSSVSASTAVSSGSRGSFTSFNSGLGGKRDRRRRRKPLALTSAQRSDESRKRLFQCTFCTDTFKSKYDWTRHEKTLHLSLEKWICAPQGPIVVDPAKGKMCAYCDAPDPSAEHIEGHDHRQCQDRGLDARIFFRKDHLRQHLRLMHNCGMTPSMEAWKSTADQINSRCGFCEQRFTVWQQRNDHLAAHFKAGAHMRDWKGCRGLDPSVAVQVTNAMPPYLIGIDSVTPNPFSATNRQQRETCWERLAVSLGAWVTEKARQGVRLTDEMLQAQARIIEFGTDDNWNSTAAENAEWLDLFKKAHGMNYIPGCFGGEGLAVPEDLETYSDLGLRIPFSVQLRTYNEPARPKPQDLMQFARNNAQQLQMTCQRLAEQGILRTPQETCPHPECDANQIDIALLSPGPGAAHSLFRWCTHHVSPDTQEQLQACILAAQSLPPVTQASDAPLPLSVNPDTGAINRKPFLQRHRLELPVSAAPRFATTTRAWPDSGSMAPVVSTDELLQKEQQQIASLPPATTIDSPMDMLFSGPISQNMPFGADGAASLPLTLPTALDPPAHWSLPVSEQDEATMLRELDQIIAEVTSAADPSLVAATDGWTHSLDAAATVDMMDGVRPMQGAGMAGDGAGFDDLEMRFDDVFGLAVDDAGV